jgi:hypothetical protein
MSIFLQTVLAAETGLAERLALKLPLTGKNRLVPDRLRGFAQANRIENGWAGNVSFKSIIGLKKYI